MKLRVFIGIFPPKEVLEKVRDISRMFAKEKRNLKFVQPDQLHLTLKFLGADVKKESVEYIIDTLNRHKSALVRPGITVESPHFGFKGQIRAKVLFLPAHSDELDNLATTINDIIKNLQLDDIAPRKDRKKFTHHITIARARSTVNRNFKKKVDEVLNKATSGRIKFSPEYLSVMSSELLISGPKYTELARIPLSEKPA